MDPLHSHPLPLAPSTPHNTTRKRGRSLDEKCCNISSEETATSAEQGRRCKAREDDDIVDHQQQHQQQQQPRSLSALLVTGNSSSSFQPVHLEEPTVCASELGGASFSSDELRREMQRFGSSNVGGGGGDGANTATKNSNVHKAASNSSSSSRRGGSDSSSSSHEGFRRATSSSFSFRHRRRLTLQRGFSSDADDTAVDRSLSPTIQASSSSSSTGFVFVVPSQQQQQCAATSVSRVHLDCISTTNINSTMLSPNDGDGENEREGERRRHFSASVLPPRPSSSASAASSSSRRRRRPSSSTALVHPRPVTPLPPCQNQVKEDEDALNEITLMPTSEKRKTRSDASTSLTRRTRRLCVDVGRDEDVAAFALSPVVDDLANNGEDDQQPLVRMLSPAPAAAATAAVTSTTAAATTTVSRSYDLRRSMSCSTVINDRSDSSNVMSGSSNLSHLHLCRRAPHATTTNKEKEMDSTPSPNPKTCAFVGLQQNCKHTPAQTSTSATMTLSCLPEDLMSHILTFLLAEQLCTIASVSQEMKSLSSRPYLWRKLCVAHFRAELVYFQHHSRHVLQMLTAKSVYRHIRNMTLDIEFVSGPRTGQVHTVLRRRNCHVTVGRSRSNDISILHDEMISRRHAVISDHDNRLWLRDVGGINGTFIDEEALPQYVDMPLPLGAVVEMGVSTFCIRPRPFIPVPRAIRTHDHPALYSAENFVAPPAVNFVSSQQWGIVPPPLTLSEPAVVIL